MHTGDPLKNDLDEPHPGFRRAESFRSSLERLLRAHPRSTEVIVRVER